MSDAAGAGKPVTLAELDELTRALADRYVGLLSSTCAALQTDNPDPVQRREAQDLLANGATNIYDIASSADAFTRTLDLVIVTTLISQVWIDDDRAGDIFGDRAEVLVRALHHGRVEAWALAAQVLRPAQLDLLDYLIWDWRRHNPDMVQASFVRFSSFAVGRGRSADAEVLAAGGFFASIEQAAQSIDEARLLSERLFYLSKRYPTLLRWQVAAIKNDLVATPEVVGALADAHRLTDQFSQLPKHVASERQAILVAIDDRLKGADAALGNVRDALADATRTSDSLSETLKTANSLFTKVDAWHRWSVTQPGHRAFDIREYTQGAKELREAMTELNNLMQSSGVLLKSSEWDRRVEQITRSADARMKLATEYSQQVVDTAFRRLYVALSILFALLILYRVIAFLLGRRLRAAEKPQGAES